LIGTLYFISEILAFLSLVLDAKYLSFSYPSSEILSNTFQRFLLSFFLEDFPPSLILFSGDDV